MKKANLLSRYISFFFPPLNFWLKSAFDVELLMGYVAFSWCYKQVSVTDEIIGRVNAIKAMLRSMEDGEISVSAYDTAWVALVEDIHGSGGPQFPTSLQWIVDNQLSDGSWGDRKIFSPHDRIINTLACVVALKFWNIYHERCKRGTFKLTFNYYYFFSPFI